MAAQARVTRGDGKKWVDSVFWGCTLRTGLWELDSQWRRAGRNKPTQGIYSTLGPQKGEGKIRSEREEAATAKGGFAFITVKIGIVFKTKKKPVKR